MADVQDLIGQARASPLRRAVFRQGVRPDASFDEVPRAEHLSRGGKPRGHSGPQVRTLQ